MTTPVTSIPPVTPVTAAATAAAAPAAAGRAIFTGPRDVDGQLAALEFLVVKHFDGLVGVFCARHFHEGEAAGFAGELVQHHVNGSDNARLGEKILQIIVHCLVGKVAYEETRFIHNQYTLAAQKTEWGVAALAVSLNVARYGG
jgi:hypothetical protein